MPLIAPHKPLSKYYGEEASRASFVRGLFDEAAPHYEWINSVMSLGSGKAYRRFALQSAGLGRGMRILDVATGTGLVARAAASLVGPEGKVIGLDPSMGMLKQQRPGENTRLVRALGEGLPFRGEVFDFLSLGYGLRHVADLGQLFRDSLRVLKPGGRLLIMEFSRPEGSLGQWLGRVYLQKVIPTLTRLGTRDRGAQHMMRYCWDTVDTLVDPEVVMGALRDAGFSAVGRKCVAGIFAEYSGEKAPPRVPAAG